MAADTSKPILQTVGNYDLLQKVAEGGMGAVYRARDRTSGQTVAVKLVTPQMASNPIIAERFKKEYEAAQALDHPNIVRALDNGTTGGRPYLVMEFVEGESLGQKLERDGKLPEAEAIRIITLVANGLDQAHQRGLIHRDIKPDNVLLTPEGQVKLADLGLVKNLETDNNLTKTGRGLGTPHFMAPEQFKNAKNADVRCDVYSLGATLYHMVTGKMPFHALGPLDAWMKKVNNELSPARKVNPAVSERTDAVIRRAMNPEANQRPASCSEFLEELSGAGPRKQAATKPEPAGGELWYLKYRDEEGVLHMVKGSVNGIRRSLKEGLLGDASNVQAGRSKTGQFEPLRNVAEFRDLVVGARKSARPPTTPETGSATTRSAEEGAAAKGPHIPLTTDGPRLREYVLVTLLVLGAAIAGVLGTLFLTKYF